ncbi:hypothetical protein [Streptomyces sp. NPDC088350]|uniref:hypothetical protein n=1 Tax=Streptomyces sp. NPDC088350 TaxID=3365854 RepID=UPI003815D6FF
MNAPRVLDLFSCAGGAAMGITWTDVHEELTEAIPPAYTRWLGTAFLTVGQEVFA